MDTYINIAKAIISEQELVVGPLAWSEARKVSGLNVKDHTISIKGDHKKILEGLVKQYETLFGQASVEVCKDAAKKFFGEVDKSELPEVLVG